MALAVPRSRLRPADALRTGAGSLRSRSWRAALSALGIAIGIGAAVAVLGVSASSRAALLSELGAEGNLLTVSAGQDVTGAPAPLPAAASGMIARIPPVQTVSAVGYVPSALVRRTAAVPAVDSGGISVLATQTSLLHTLGGTVARGTFLNAATIHYPAVVLGAVAARTLGITRVPPGTLVYLGGHYFSVVGILRPVPLAPEIDEAALVGFPSRTPSSVWAATPPRSTCAPSRTRSRRWPRCCPLPRTRPCPRESRSASHPRCWPRGRRRGRRSPACSWPSAASR